MKALHQELQSHRCPTIASTMITKYKSYSTNLISLISLLGGGKKELESKQTSQVHLELHLLRPSKGYKIVIRS
jgi:hypothetical protein